MKHAKRRGDFWELYDPKSGELFLLPTAAPLEHYLKKGFLVEKEERANHGHPARGTKKEKR